MTSVFYEPGEYRLRVEGHAGAADGIDPVCAGASALAWALVEAATARDEYRASLFVDERNAVIEVECEPTADAARDCRYMFEIILGGLMLIAEAHPDNMQIRIGG